MYDPVKDGIDKSFRSVVFSQMHPPQKFARLVHSYWELKTVEELSSDFQYHALPDACVNILFNLLDANIAGVTALRTSAETLNLGKSFHYSGIQLYPGVWRGNKEEIFDRYVGTPYIGALPLLQTNKKLIGLDFNRQSYILTDLVQWFVDEKLIVLNKVTDTILGHLEQIRSVTDMAELTRLSPRQLQRTIKQVIGLSPHDFLKILRVQQSFTQHFLDFYADQSHYIHSFRDITGLTPTKYKAKFDV
jgi:AraC-like DNA-binding protein